MLDLIDIGANLTHESFAADLPDVLGRARVAGVSQMMVTGASREGSFAALALARAHPGVLFASAGVHPHHAAELDDEVEAELRDLLAEPEVRAAGEAGLDYFRDYCPHDLQRRAFERQLALAEASGKPLFAHMRDAHDDFRSMLDDFRDRLGPVVVHCFTAGRRELFDYLDRDCHIGITGWLCDERRGAHLRELVRSIPADRLLIETDSPYLLPRTLRPKPGHRRNEPAFLAHILEELARDRGEDPAETAAQTSANARRFFGLPTPAAGAGG